MRFVILISALFFIACGGDTLPEGQTPDAPVFETNYRVIAEESTLRFSAQQEGEPFEGQFETFSAAIWFDDNDLDNSQVAVTIPLTSVDAESTDRNSNLPNKVWLDMKAFPNAEFVSDDIRRKDEGYVAHGSLRLKGVNHPVILPFTLSNDDRGRTVMRGQTVLNRTDWRVGDAPWDTDEYVSRSVTLDIQLIAEPTG